MEANSIPPRAKGKAILDTVIADKRLTIRLPEDREWLETFTAHPNQLLAKMVKRGMLYKAGSNRYVVAPYGTTRIEQVATPELIIDLQLRSLTPYYIGFLSALIKYRLTDLHSLIKFVAVPTGKTPRTDFENLQLTELSLSQWPDDGEIERFRVTAGTKEFAFCSSLERTLVDSLTRPELCAGIETVVCCWAKAAQNSEVDWDKVASIARRMGNNISRRVAFLLRKLGLEIVVERNFPDMKGRGSKVLLDRSKGFPISKEDIRRDSSTGIIINVPYEYLTGWLLPN